MKKFWNDERRARAQTLAAEGKSAAQIAADLGHGCTRNAVVGRAFRDRVKKSGAPDKPIILKAHAGGRGTIDKTLTIRRAIEAGRDTHEMIAARFQVSLAHVRKLSQAMGKLKRGSTRQVEDARTRARIAARLKRRSEDGLPPVVGYRPESFAHGYQGQQGRVALEELERQHCRFPIDMPADDSGKIETRYCGAATEPDGRYCTHHAARCYVAPKRNLSGESHGLPLKHLNVGGWA
jgi:hypothetical protein